MESVTASEQERAAAEQGHVIDVDRLVTELRDRVAEQRAAGHYADDLSVYEVEPPAPPEISVHFRPEVAELTQKRFVGPMVVAVRRFLVRVLRVVHEDFALQVSAALREFDSKLSAEIEQRITREQALEQAVRQTVGQAVDELRRTQAAAREATVAELNAERAAREALERRLLEGGDLRPSDDELPPPWSDRYWPRHVAVVSHVLDRPEMIRAFALSGPLPPLYGIGLDERVVELPWVFAQKPSGRALDAGSSLNHGHVLERFLPAFSELTIVTLEPEEVAFPNRRVSYVYADLRELPFREDAFDSIVCVSTLEHVGMDNALYGAETPAGEDAWRATARAIEELRRVLVPGGMVFVTVPYGVREDHGWQRQFDRADVDRLLDLLAPDDFSLAVYRYTERGWQRSDFEEASSARYHNWRSYPTRPADFAAAARAVVCLRARL